MKIEFKTTDKNFTFADVPIQEPFEYLGTVYMRICTRKLVDNSIINCVSFNTGSTFYFHQDDGPITKIGKFKVVEE